MREPTRRRGVEPAAIGDLAIGAALALVAGASRAGPLGPRSLWGDDAWVALSAKARGGRELVRVGVTAPGFSTVIGGWTRVFGDSTRAAQALPFGAGVLGPPVLYWTGLRLGLRRWAAVLAAVLLLTSRTHLTFSTRVKQYTFDALAVSVLLALAWAVVQAPGERRRWAWFGGVAAGTSLVSPAVAPVVLAGFVAAAVALWRLPSPRPLRPALVAGAVWVVVMLVLALLVRGATANPALRNSVAYGYLSVGDATAIVRAVFANFTPLPFWPAAALVLGGTGVLAWRRPLLALLLTTPPVLALVLSAARAVPLAGRFEVYLYPCLALLVAGGLSELPDVLPRPVPAAVPAIAGLALAAAVLVRIPDPLPYPAEGVRPLVEVLEHDVRAGDAVLSPFSTSYAFALYTHWPVSFSRSRRYLTDFRATVDQPGVQIIDPHYDIGWSGAAAGKLDPVPWPASLDEPVVDRAVAGRGRVWLLGSDADLGVEAMLRARGFTLLQTVRPRGAYSRLTLWVR